MYLTRKAVPIMIARGGGSIVNTASAAAMGGGAAGAAYTVSKHGLVGLIPALLKPLEIAELALFLASDEAKHINGATIPIDGGWASA